VGQASEMQVSLHQARVSILDLDKTLDIHLVQLPNGALRVETEEATSQIL